MIIMIGKIPTNNVYWGAGVFSQSNFLEWRQTPLEWQQRCSLPLSVVALALSFGCLVPLPWQPALQQVWPLPIEQKKK